MSDWLPMIIGGSLAGAGLVYIASRAISRKLREMSRRREHPKHVEKTATILDAMMSLLERQRALSNEITDSLEKKAHELKELIHQADQTIARLAARVHHVLGVSAPLLVATAHPKET